MIHVEIAKLLRRRRTWVAIGLLCLLPIIVAFFLKLSPLAPRPGEGPAFLSAVVSNGSLFPAAALGIVLPLFLPVAVAVIAGDAIAGEASSGTLRYLLVRPVGRTRLLVAKLVSILVFLGLAVSLVAGSAYVVGVSLFGSNPVLTSLSGTVITPADLARRTVLVLLYVAWSMVGVASIALLLSTLTDSSLGAALGALAALVLSQVLVTLDAADAVQPYLPTRYWLSWVDIFRDPILWHDVERGVLVQGVYVVVLLGISWAGFMTRDITS